MERTCEHLVKGHFANDRQMVLLSVLRQVGKTTLVERKTSPKEPLSESPTVLQRSLSIPYAFQVSVHVDKTDVDPYGIQRLGDKNIGIGSDEGSGLKKDIA